MSDGVTFAELMIVQGATANATDRFIQCTATGESLAVRQNVTSSTLDVLDYKTIAGVTRPRLATRDP